MGVLYKNSSGDVVSLIPEINNIDDSTIAADTTYSSEKIEGSYPITTTATGSDLTLSTSSGNLNALTVYGKSEVVDGSIKSAGEGWATVDLGTLTWTYESSVTRFYASLPSQTTTINRTDLICAKYKADVSPVWNTHIDKTICFYAGTNVYVNDYDYTDPTAFKNSLSGVILAYQLADPTQGNTIAIKTDDGTGIDGTMAVFTTGTPLRGIPDTTVRDVMAWDGSAGTVTKNCGKVKLANLPWNYTTSATLNPFFWTYTELLPSGNIKYRGEFSTTLYNVICPAYPTVKRNGTEFINKTLTVDGGLGNVSQLQIKDTDYTTVEDFVASLGDAELVYELATPTTEQLTTAENASIAGLRTFEPQTHAQNNAGAEMTVEAYARTANGKAVNAVNARLDSIINDSAATSTTTYSSNKIIELDDNILAQIVEPFVSGKTYYYDDVFEYNDEIFKQAYKNSAVAGESPYTDGAFAKMPPLADMYKGCWIGTSDQLTTDYDETTGPFIFTTDDNEKIWMNIISISLPKFNPNTNRWGVTIDRTTNNPDHNMFGLILAKNDLTGIENVDDAERLLKIEKVEGEYVVTYANSVMSKKTSSEYGVYLLNNVTKGTTNTGYVRAYAVFNYGTDNEIVAYTPCRVLTWGE